MTPEPTPGTFSVGLPAFQVGTRVLIDGREGVVVHPRALVVLFDDSTDPETVTID